MKFFLIALVVIPLFTTAQVETDRTSASEVLSMALKREVKSFTMSNETIDRIDVVENGVVVRYTGEKLQTLLKSVKSYNRQQLDLLVKKAFDDDWLALVSKKGRQ